MFGQILPAAFVGHGQVAQCLLGGAKTVAVEGFFNGVDLSNVIVQFAQQIADDSNVGGNLSHANLMRACSPE
jgi:hypothetical protein